MPNYPVEIFSKSVASLDDLIVVAYKDSHNQGTISIGKIQTTLKSIKFGRKINFSRKLPCFIKIVFLEPKRFIIAFVKPLNKHEAVALAGTIIDKNNIIFGGNFVFSNSPSCFIKISATSPDNIILSCVTTKLIDFHCMVDDTNKISSVKPTIKNLKG